MSPVAAAGPPHTRSAYINGGGPVSTAHGMKANDMARSNGDGRVFPHLDDLKAVRPEIDVNSPIRKILQEAELLAKQADTHLDFRRPDIALQEFVKASILAVEVVPRHKDYPSLSTDRGELHRSYLALMRRIDAQTPKFAGVKQTIKKNNEESGVRPMLGRDASGHEVNRATWGSDNYHTRSKSAQHLPTNSTATNPNVINSASLSNGSSNGATIRRKPPVQPKPDALHGNALHGNAPQPSSTTFTTSQTDLASRFARLRSPGSGSPIQDPRIRTQSISIPGPLEHIIKSPTTSLVPKFPTTVRPLGPREMPSVPSASPQSLRMSLDDQLPGMPRPPDAIYSPSRGTETAATMNLPSSAPRSSPYLGSGNNAAPPVSTVGRTPSFDSRPDYFSHPQRTSDNGPPKRQDPILPDSTTVTAEDLTRYLRMGSLALRILLVDVRTREEFDNGHIMSSSIICVEPITLRNGISSEELAESIVVSPDSEQKLYEERDEFDLVIFYDQRSSSTKPSNLGASNGTYLQDFAKAMYDYGYEKRLKRRPMLLLGGLDAWVDLMGPGSLQSSSTGSSTAKRVNGSSSKSYGSLSRVPIARDTRHPPILRKRTYESRPLSKEEESKWDETLRENPIIESPAAGDQEDPEEFSYVRTTEDFFRRYPELPTIQESMITPRPAPPIEKFHQELISSMPRPPARPAPALPRTRSSGILEKAPTATHATTTGYGSASIASSHVSAGLTGLKNSHGVSCYTAAVIQCLSATGPLRDFLIQFRYPPERLPPRKKGETTDPPQLLVRNFGNLLGHIWSGQYDFVAPSTLLNYVNAIHLAKMPRNSPKNQAFGGSARQHDTGEFLIYILDVLHDELNLSRDKPNYEALLAQLTEKQQDGLSFLNRQFVIHQEWQRYLVGENSYLSNLFFGQEVFLTNCQAPGCGYSGKRWRGFQMIQLHLPATRSGVNTMSLMEVFYESHNSNRGNFLEGYKCPVCKREETCRQTTAISYFPDYLIIELARFQNMGADSSKIETQIKFSEKLDLSPIFVPLDDEAPKDLDVPQGQRGPFIYDVYGVIQHFGRTLQGGHYIAIARSLDKPAEMRAHSWHRFNDQVVTRTDFSDTQKANVTHIFCKRRRV